MPWSRPRPRCGTAARVASAQLLGCPGRPGRRPCEGRPSRSRSRSTTRTRPPRRCTARTRRRAKSPRPPPTSRRWEARGPEPPHRTGAARANRQRIAPNQAFEPSRWSASGRRDLAGARGRREIPARAPRAAHQRRSAPSAAKPGPSPIISPHSPGTGRPCAASPPGRTESSRRTCLPYWRSTCRCRHLILSEPEHGDRPVDHVAAASAAPSTAMSSPLSPCRSSAPRPSPPSWRRRCGGRLRPHYAGSPPGYSKPMTPRCSGRNRCDAPRPRPRALRRQRKGARAVGEDGGATPALSRRSSS